jgi:hypothetical protein
MYSIGVTESLVILVVLLGAVLVPAWKVFSKAGYPGLLSIAMLVPGLNLIALYFLAFSEWPVLKELSYLRQRVPPQGATQP